MTKVIKLRESDIHRMVKRVLKEDNSTQYKVVKRKDGKYEIHMKYAAGFKLPSGTFYTNGGKGYNSEEEANKAIKSMTMLKPRKDGIVRFPDEKYSDDDEIETKRDDDDVLNKDF